MNPLQSPEPREWTNNEKVLFRFFFLFYLLLAVPLDWKYYAHLSSVRWSGLSYTAIFNLSRYTPQFSGRYIPGIWSLGSWYDLLITGLLSLAGLVAWSLWDRGRKEYNILYALLRIVLRYRLAIGILGYGIIKLFPLQAPFPSLSNLNTSYGDFSAWKIFSMSLGIAPGYESFLGGVEVLAGMLLFFRRTATIGALIILVFTGNVLISNIAYEGGEQLYSFYLSGFALFIFSFDALRIYRLVSLRAATSPGRVQLFAGHGLRIFRLALKTAFFGFFVLFYGYQTYRGFRRNPYQFPATAGLKHTAGIYHVAEFRLNGKLIPYSATDPVRWKDVVFEKWTTISIRSNRSVKPIQAIYETTPEKDIDRVYELAGTTGRHYYNYRADTVKHTLLLENKNHNYSGEQLHLNYQQPDSSTILLNGTDQQGQKLAVVLHKTDKQYPVLLGRRRILKL